MKNKETLEEFSRRRFNEQKLDTYTSYNIEDAIKEGAKWQAERSYSQNDMWEAYKASNTIFEDEIALRQEFEEWFEQFKKQ
mgnify:CR=1 FL=1